MLKIATRIPITVSPWFWGVALLIGWLWSGSMALALLSVVFIFFSILVHEMGHALTALAFGQASRIELTAFGGYTIREGRGALGKEFLIVLNGPLASVTLAGVSYLLQTAVAWPLWHLSFHFIYVINLVWTCINLVPVLPLDGGYLLNIALEGLFGFRGIKASLWLGLIVSAVVGLLFFVYGLLFVGALFLILMFENVRSLREYRILSARDREPKLQRLLQRAQDAYEAGDIESATTQFQHVREEGREGILFTIATIELARLHADAGRKDKGYELLHPLHHQLTGESLQLFQRLAYANHDYATLMAIANRCYQEHPLPSTAVMSALAFGARGHVTPAVGWLECAIREGLPHPEQIIEALEFDPIRTDPAFQRLVDLYSK